MEMLTNFIQIFAIYLIEFRIMISLITYIMAQEYRRFRYLLFNIHKWSICIPQINKSLLENDDTIYITYSRMLEI